MSQKPHLQLSLPCKFLGRPGLDFQDIPQAIEPFWTGVGCPSFPYQVKFSVLHRWVDGDGDFEFNYRIEPDEARAMSSKRSLQPGEPAFLDIVTADIMFEKAGTRQWIVECDGEEVLRYPFEVTLAPTVPLSRAERRRMGRA